MRIKRRKRMEMKASKPLSLHIQCPVADLATSARGGRGGGIEGGRGRDRERRRRGGCGVDRRVAVCSIRALRGGWRGWGWLYHPRQWSARLQSKWGQGLRRVGKTIEVELLEWTAIQICNETRELLNADPELCVRLLMQNAVHQTSHKLDKVIKDHFTCPFYKS